MSFAFNFNEADTTLDQMANVNTKIEQALTELDGFTNTQLAEWTGGAQEHYHSAKTRWDAAATRMGGALGEARNALMNISSGYQSADSSGAGVWS